MFGSIAPLRHAVPSDLFGVFMNERINKGVPRALRLAVLARDRYRCAYCGSRLNLQCDHILPVSRGGETTLANLRSACRDCNLSKSDRTPEEWLR